MELTQEQIKTKFTYDPETGFLYFLNHKFKKLSGTRAGWLDKSTGYYRISIDRKKFYIHQIAWFYMTGEFPLEVDHRNRVKTDNRWDNLRLGSHAQNMANCELRSSNKTGFRGVSKDPRRDKWRARVFRNSKEIWLGYYDTPEKAALAYNEAALKLYGEFAVLNEVPPVLAREKAKWV